LSLTNDRAECSVISDDPHDSHDNACVLPMSVLPFSSTLPFLFQRNLSFGSAEFGSALLPALSPSDHAWRLFNKRSPMACTSRASRPGERRPTIASLALLSLRACTLYTGERG
jgi:hypothetical protein